MQVTLPADPAAVVAVATSICPRTHLRSKRMKITCCPKCTRSEHTANWRRSAWVQGGSEFESWVWVGQCSWAGTLGGAGSGRVGIGIRNEDDHSYQHTFSTPFSTFFFFRVSVADGI